MLTKNQQAVPFLRKEQPRKLKYVQTNTFWCLKQVKRRLKLTFNLEGKKPNCFLAYCYNFKDAMERKHHTSSKAVKNSCNVKLLLKNISFIDFLTPFYLKPERDFEGK